LGGPTFSAASLRVRIQGEGLRLLSFFHLLAENAAFYSDSDVARGFKSYQTVRPTPSPLSPLSLSLPLPPSLSLLVYMYCLVGRRLGKARPKGG